MCYSAMVWADYRKYVRRFGADLDIKEFVRLFKNRRMDSGIRIPKAMELAFADPLSNENQQIQALITLFNESESSRLEQEVFTQKTRQSEAARKLEVKATKTAQNDHRIATKKIDAALAALANLRKTELKSSDSRIYPGWYAPVLVIENGRHVVKPMRYRCRLPGWTLSVERKYDGTYNARRDKFKESWSKLFGYKHGIAVFDKFYENVQRSGENEVLEFEPKNHEPMLVACLWSDWQGDSPYPLHSFAAITDDPPAEVKAAGHDRCPIPIKAENLDAWLNPDPDNLDALQAILDDRVRPYYEHRLAKAA